MPHMQTVLRVFLASPSDVNDERDGVEQVITELNNTWSGKIGIRLELIRWETHAVPGLGEDAQAVINREIPQDYDIFIGIMWTRFGTPTERAASGTYEEFQHAVSRHTREPQSISVMVYFKDVAVIPSQIDADQLAAVQRFRHEISTSGLYFTFESRDTLLTLLRMHLSRKVQEWSERAGTKDAGSSITVVQTSVQAMPAGSEAPEELGLIDLIEFAEDGIGRLNGVMTGMAAELDRLSVEIISRTGELNDAKDASGSIDRSVMKQVGGRAARNLKDYASTVAVNTPVFQSATHSTFAAIADSAALYLDFDENGVKELRTIHKQIIVLRPALARARGTTSGFRRTLERLPRITAEFNSARSSAVRELLKLDSAFETAENLAAEAEAAVHHAISDYQARADGEDQGHD
jgi:hypothetical protein